MILKKIYLTWCHGRGGGRYLVGVLNRETSAGDDIVFKYLSDEITAAKKAGFLNYPEFPDLGKTYKVNIRTAFSLRLFPQSRADRGRYLSFWDANIDGLDWFDELGFTQGKLATDTFEFMADFPKRYNGEGIKFISNIAGLSHIKVKNNIIEENDKLRFELEPKNVCDEMAVKIFKGENFIGYVKRGHNLFFQKILNSEVDLRVKAIERGESVNQIYYSIKVIKMQ
jgi:hypothetical protein